MMLVTDGCSLNAATGVVVVPCAAVIRRCPFFVQQAIFTEMLRGSMCGQPYVAYVIFYVYIHTHTHTDKSTTDFC